MNPKIQRYELDHYDIAIHCPFCGQSVVPQTRDLPANAEPVEATPCPHTLFVASDEGFDYRSARYNEAIGLPATANGQEPDLAGEGYDAFTDRTPIPNALKIASYIPAPSGFGGYVAFAPRPK